MEPKKEYTVVVDIKPSEWKLFKSYCAFHELKYKDVAGDIVSKFVQRECKPRKSE